MGLDEIAESEGLDRSNLRLAQNQVDLLQAVAAVNPKIVGIVQRQRSRNAVAGQLPSPVVRLSGRSGRAPLRMH